MKFINGKLNEKDLFVTLFGLFLIAVYFLKIPTYPYRFESLIVVFLFLLTTKSLVEGANFFPYLVISVIGLVLSTFLSPYGLLIFYTIALLMYKKTNLI